MNIESLLPALEFKHHNWKDFYQEKLLVLEKLREEHSHIPNVLLVESDVEKFIVTFWAGVKAGINLFLCNPNWQEREWEQVFLLVNPDVVLGKIDYKNSKHQKPQNRITIEPIIGIPTGGTSGKIKFASHTFETLSASVTGFTNYFQRKKINSLCLLPLYHVSGLMQLLRSCLTTGKFIHFSYHDLKQGIKPNINPQDFFISLVPTQLVWLIKKDVQWLSQFNTVLLGGRANIAIAAIKSETA